MFLEPKALYNSPKAATPVPDDFEVLLVTPGSAEKDPIFHDHLWQYHPYVSGSCRKTRKGRTGISVEVLDLRSLIPLDEDAILNTVKKDRESHGCARR